MIKDSSYWRMWQENRIKFILEKYPEGFFKGKRILELGPFNGYVGSFFQDLGADVYMIEGRPENVENIKRDYQDSKVECANLDTKDWKWWQWDIIINFGLFYHLENFHRQHLFNCVNNCSILFFESIVFDNNQSVIYYRDEVNSLDQSLSSYGGTPSTSYIENIFKKLNVRYEKFCDPKLNSTDYNFKTHHYDWLDTNSNIPDGYARRFWIVENF
jgi:hypothetical protein